MKAETKTQEESKILSYFHCGKCLEELREDDLILHYQPKYREDLKSISAQEYSQLSVGATEEGIQIWCDRHDCEVGHIRLKEVK